MVVRAVGFAATCGVAAGALVYGVRLCMSVLSDLQSQVARAARRIEMLEKQQTSTSAQEGPGPDAAAVRVSSRAQWLAASASAPSAPLAVPEIPEDGAPAHDESRTSLFALLPAEALQRILGTLRAPTLVRCERVCREWKGAVATLPLWSAWRGQSAIVSESAFVVPGTMALAFGAPPAEISAETRAAGVKAATRALQVPHHELEMAASGASWTVLTMSDGGEPTPLRQHSARDFMITCCPVSSLVFSGDREGMLRVWCARSGQLLSRVPFPGAAVCALGSSIGRVIIGDSQGKIYVLSVAALLEGNLTAVSWRAHDGKTSCICSRPYDSSFLSGGSDGAVRQWQYDLLAREASTHRDGGVHGPHGAALGHGASDGSSRAAAGCVGCGACIDLGLFAMLGAQPTARHRDTITALARDDVYAVSASREGHIQITVLLDGTPAFAIRGCGSISCVAAHRGKLFVCSDDGYQATLQLWDMPIARLVQETGGIRKWSAPSSVAYMGYDKAFWVRDTSLYVLRWVEAPSNDAVIQ